MKRLYITPDVEVIKVQMRQQILNVSLDGDYQEGDPVLAPEIPSSVFDI